MKRTGISGGDLRRRLETVAESESFQGTTLRPRRAKTPSGPGIWYAPRRVTHFRFRRFAQTRHGLHGGESPRCCVSAAAAGPLLATGQVFGPSAHLQRAQEPAAHRVAAGEELLREVEEASRGLRGGGWPREETHRGPASAPA